MLGALILFIGLNALSCVSAAPNINTQRYMKFMNLHDKSKTLLAGGKYEDALKAFKEVIDALEPVEHISRNYANAVEFSYFYSGTAQLELKQPDKAFDWFTRYQAKYPQGAQVHVATILMADILATKEKWEEVANRVNPLAANNRLPVRIHIAAHELRAEAYFHLKKYEAAAGSAKYLYDRVPEKHIRTDAAIMFSICMVRLKRYKDLYTFLPNIEYPTVRYDSSLNRALIAEGDREYTASDYDTALLLYRLVYPKTELEGKMAELIRDVELYRDGLSDRSGDNVVRNSSAIKRKLERLLKDLAKEQAALLKMPDYDQELSMRSANCYFELRRYREAIQSFWGVYKDFPDHELADQALYSTFTTSYMMGDIERAVKEGYAYLRIFPKGKFYDTLSLNLVQIHYQLSEFQECVDLARKSLAHNPKHSSADQLRYLIGYNLFQLEKLQEASQAFDAVLEKHPESMVAESAAYWQAMCTLYIGDYPPAEKQFHAFTNTYSGGIFYADSVYRLGICQYGNGDFSGSATTLEFFTEKFPEQDSLPEALTMLGDIYASEAELDKALFAYQSAISNGVTMVQINRATFQIAKMFRLEERWQETLDLFNTYLAQWKTKGNFTEALYWIGTSLQQLDRPQEALDTFFNAIIQYGDKPEHHGIDMILRDLSQEIQTGKAGPELYAFKDNLYDEILVAREAKRTTLYLRLVSFFSFLVENETDRQGMVDAISKREYIRYAGPLTLTLMGESALRRNDAELASAIYTHFLEEHGESELAVKALKAMAEINIEQGEFDDAERYLDEISGRFSSLGEAAWAALKRADIHRLRKNYTLAINGFKQVISVKEWRGPLWAEALYRIGQCEMEQGKTQEASAYFQRVYVMYEGYKEWAAKSYLQSAHCLMALNKKSEAQKTCQELINHPNLNKTPQVEEAKALLSQWRGGGQ